METNKNINIQLSKHCVGCGIVYYKKDITTVASWKRQKYHSNICFLHTRNDRPLDAAGLVRKADALARKEKKQSGNYKKCISCGRWKELALVKDKVCNKCQEQMDAIWSAVATKMSMCMRRAPSFYSHRDYKICRNCFKKKPFKDFGADRTNSKDGKSSYCRPCYNAITKLGNILRGRHKSAHGEIDISAVMKGVFNHEK